jgi:DNA replication ATP-dependent helicase Dna2
MNKHLHKFSNRNTLEAKICERLLKTFSDLNYDSNQIAILTPYKEQEKYLKEQLTNFKDNIYTIDKAQGMEKNVIILSLVKIDMNCSLLQHKSRVNVAFTRSKVKLIVIGMYNIISKIEVIKKFIEKIKLTGTITELPVDTLL